MNIQILQELKAYSLQELQEIFNTNEKEVDDILKSLSIGNIIKKISKSSYKLELERYLELENINNLNINLEEDKYIFNYVGMLTIKEICLIIYPKYIKDCKMDGENDYKTLKRVLAVIKKYNSKNQKQQVIGDSNSTNYNLLAITLELIEKFLEYGLYSNDIQIIEQNGVGEIFWEKTINESTAYISNEVPIYLENFTINQENNEQDYFKRLHATIITEACNKMKDILSILGKEYISISNEKIENFGNLDYIVYKLNQRISYEFVTYKQELLKILKRYIILQESNKKESDSILYIGTNSFNLVWEDVCSVVMNNCLNKSMKELGLTYGNDKKESVLLSDIITKPIWKHNLSGKEHRTNKTLTPDIITIEEKSISIYDAKYYQIKLDEIEVKNQPGITDITKQYLYELAYKDFVNENNLIVKNNAFLFPLDGNEEIRVGVATFEIFYNLGNVKLKDIEVILKPCDKMYRVYLNEN